MGRSYWMLVGTLENFCKTKEHGFTVQGIRQAHRNKAKRMQPGDRVLYYLTGALRFAGTATITSSLFEDHTPIWQSQKLDEDFPLRVRIQPDVILDDADMVDARLLAPRMKYVAKWPVEYWTLAFQGDVHLVPKSDFEMIEGELRKIMTRRAPTVQGNASVSPDTPPGYSTLTETRHPSRE